MNLQLHGMLNRTSRSYPAEYQSTRNCTYPLYHQSALAGLSTTINNTLSTLHSHCTHLWHFVGKSRSDSQNLKTKDCRVQLIHTIRQWLSGDERTVIWWSRFKILCVASEAMIWSTNNVQLHSQHSDVLVGGCYQTCSQCTVTVSNIHQCTCCIAELLQT